MYNIVHTLVNMPSVKSLEWVIATVDCDDLAYESARQASAQPSANEW